MKGREILPADLAARYEPGEPYRPSNGTEGGIFQEAFCDDCWHDSEWRQTEEGGCSLIALTMVMQPGEEGYPSQWIYDDDGQPCCTAFVASPCDTECCYQIDDCACRCHEIAPPQPPQPPKNGVEAAENDVMNESKHHMTLAGMKRIGEWE